MKENMSARHRAAKRYPTQEPARLEVIGKKDLIYCHMKNLSSTGAYFVITNSNYSPKAGDRIRIMLHLKQINASHIINAKVVWSKGYGLGVSFIKHK